MTRQAAIGKVRKLRQVTVEHGATAPEALSARDLADRLVARFDLRHGDLMDTPLMPPPMAPPPGVMIFFFGNGAHTGQNANTATFVW